jgi:hypothetical protein
MRHWIASLASAAFLSACAIVNVNPMSSFYTGGDFYPSVEACDAACTHGDAHACGYMAQAALFGIGLPRSGAKAFDYATRGCNGGDGRGCAQVALAYATGTGVARDPSRAAAFNERGCTLGFSVACASLGYYYRDGNGVTKDAEHAKALFARGCDLGSALGCLHLALGETDRMVPEDRASRALPLLVHDCEPHRNPEPRVCSVAARMLANGRGTVRDTTQARTLYDTACTRGDPDACDAARQLETR